MQVLKKDYDLECWNDPWWWGLFIVALAGGLCISLGCPLILWYKLRRQWKDASGKPLVKRAEAIRGFQEGKGHSVGHCLCTAAVAVIVC